MAVVQRYSLVSKEIACVQHPCLRNMDAEAHLPGMLFGVCQSKHSFGRLAAIFRRHIVLPRTQSVGVHSRMRNFGIDTRVRDPTR